MSQFQLWDNSYSAPEVEIWHFLLNWNFTCESRFHSARQWQKTTWPWKSKRSFLIHHFQCSNQLCLIICGSSPKSIEAYTYPIIQTRLCYQILGKASIDLYRFSFSSKPQIAQNYERSDIKLRKIIFKSNFKSSWDQFESRLALKMITYYFLFEGESRI